MKIFISAHSSIASWGTTDDDLSRVFNAKSLPPLSRLKVIPGGTSLPVFPIHPFAEQTLKALLENKPHLAQEDRVTRLSLAAATILKSKFATSEIDLQRCGVFLGSARSTTNSIEHSYQLFQQEHKVSPRTSPITTGGAPSSAIADLLGCTGPTATFSMTCTSAFQTLFAATGLLKSGMVERMVCGGAEAPLTSYTLEQMNALRIYSPLHQEEFPCRPCADKSHHKNTFCLGEGAGLFLLESESRDNKAREFRSNIEIAGISASRELPPTNNIHSSTGMSATGDGFYTAMREALEQAEIAKPDAVILHAPGTHLGDTAEITALFKLFNTKEHHNFQELPNLYSTKYLTGHTFGASGALSIVFAINLLRGNISPQLTFPYPLFSQLEHHTQQNKKIQTVLVNTAGFGGSFSSIVLRIHS